MRLRNSRALARAAALAGDWRSAAHHYQSLVRSGRATMRDRVQLGHALKEAGDASLALDAYRTAAARHPLDIEPQRQLGLYLRRIGRDHEALDVLARAAIVDPHATDIRAELDSYGLAEEALDQHVLHGLAGGSPVSARRPGFVVRTLAAVVRWRARHSARRRNWHEAQRHYATLVRYDPADVAANVQIGHAFLQLGAHEEALASYRHALLLNPRDPDIYLHAGHALKALGRRDSAFASYFAAWRSQPRPEAAEELRGLRSWVDDHWLRAVADGGQPAGASVQVEVRVAPRYLAEPPSLERQYRPYFRVLAGSLALKD